MHIAPVGSMNAIPAGHMTRRAAELIAMNRPDLAAMFLEGALLRDASNAAVLFDLGRIEANRGNHAKAASYGKRILGLRKPDAVASGNLLLGNAARSTGDHARAVPYFRAALKANGALSEVYCNLGGSLIDLGQLAEAEAVLLRGVELFPREAGIHANLGVLFQQKGKLEQACGYLQAALALDATLSFAWLLLGTLEFQLGLYDKAEPTFLHAARYAKDAGSQGVALYNFALVWIAQGRRADSIRILKQALALAPGLGLASGALLHQAQWMCDWDTVDEEAPKVLKLVRETPEMVAEPFAALSIPGATAADHHLTSAAYARRWLKPAPAMVPRGHNWNDGRTRLRVGFLSADFRQHPTAFLFAPVLENLDRGRIEAVALTYGDERPSDYRQRCLAACESHYDLNKDLSQSVEQAAAAIAELKLDVLVDLQCYTAQTRSEMLRFRPAPVQGQYLIFHSTAACDTYDFTILDRVICPPEIEATFTEKVLMFDGSYFPLTSPVPDVPTPSRAEEGLPENAVVFVSMNQACKISRETFEAWFAILRRVPDSVLWIRSVPIETEPVLRGKMAEAGLDPARLVIAGNAPHERHIARLRLADIGLDTWPYGSHTTASDLVANAVPIVTIEGGIPSSRVAASILRGLGLDELVQPTVEDYVNTVVRLASEPAMLDAVRAKMAGILTPENIRSRQRAYGQEFSAVLCRAREPGPRA